MNNEIINTNNNTPETANYKLKSVSVRELRKMYFPPDEWLLYPFIYQKGISILCAPRGVKKTFLAQTMACAVATPFNFLDFVAEKPRKVVYVDGEMNASSIKYRLGGFVKGYDKKGITINEDNIKIIASDLQNDDVPMPNLAKPDDQNRLEPELEGADLIIIDNVYTLYQSGKDNDSESWRMFNNWSVEQKKKGRSVLWIVHAGKGEKLTSRGSSAIETLADSILFLKKSDNGAMSCEYTKWRHLSDDEVKGFSARLIGSDKNDKNRATAFHWTNAKTEQNDKVNEILELKKAKNTYTQIEKLTGISKSKAQRIVSEHNKKTKE